MKEYTEVNVKEPTFPSPLVLTFGLGAMAVSVGCFKEIANEAHGIRLIVLEEREQAIPIGEHFPKRDGGSLRPGEVALCFLNKEGLGVLKQAVDHLMVHWDDPSAVEF